MALQGEQEDNDLQTETNLLDLDQESFCVIIEQLQPIQIQNLPDLLSVSSEFANRVTDCITEIDFTNGVPLLTKTGFLNNAVLSETIQDAVIAKYKRLREYRIGFTTATTPTFSYGYEQDEWERLVADERARWVALRNYSANEEIPALINKGLRKRIEAYGPDFTFTTRSRYGFSYHNGTMILLDDPYLDDQDESFDMQMEAYVELMAEFKGLIHTLGAGDIRIIAKFLGQPKTYPNITKIILFDNGVVEFGDLDFISVFSMADLRPFLDQLTEIDFQVSEGVDYNYTEFPIREDDNDDYYLSLLTEKKRHPELSFPNITKFDIPIPSILTREFQGIFPNVKRFYYSEEHNLARQIKELQQDLKQFGITEIREK